MWPVMPARISQAFADPGSYASRADVHGPAGHHTGIDFGSSWPVPIAGRRVRSVMRGTVVISGYNETMGNWVGVYNAERNLLVTYWHMAKRSVKVGDYVFAFTKLGVVGSTGNSTAAHLHVQVNYGRDFDYAGHVDPNVAFGVTSRMAARRETVNRALRNRRKKA